MINKLDNLLNKNNIEEEISCIQKSIDDIKHKCDGLFKEMK